MNGRCHSGSVVVLLALAFLGCDDNRARPSPANPPGSTSASATASTRLAGYLPNPDAFQWLDRSRRAAVSNDRRVVDDLKATKVIDATPVSDLGGATILPESLGGGVLFVSETAVRYAATFEGELVSIAACPQGRVTVGIGHSCVLVQGCGEAGPTFHELPTGRTPDRVLPGIVELFGTPSGLVAARTKSGALYVSACAGVRWKRLASRGAEWLSFATDDLNDATGTLGVLIAGKHFAVRADGRLEADDEAHSSNTSDNASLFHPPGRSGNRRADEESRRLLDLFAHLMAPGQAVFKEGDDLLFLDGWTGELKKSQPAALRRANCFFRRGGIPSLITCPSSKPGHTDVLRIDSWGAAPVEVLPSPTDAFRLEEITPGHALTFAGRCDGATRKGFFCVLHQDRAWKQYALPPKLLRSIVDVSGVRLAMALLNGERVVGLGRGSGGEWVFMDAATGVVHRLDQEKIPKWADRAWACAVLDQTSLRLMFEGHRDIHRGEMTQAGILDIAFDGKVTATPLAGQLRCYGPRALHLSPTGALRETLDAGRSFHEVALPPAGVTELGRCQDTGCELHAFFRVGWGPP